MCRAFCSGIGAEQARVKPASLCAPGRRITLVNNREFLEFRSQNRLARANTTKRHRGQCRFSGVFEAKKAAFLFFVGTGYLIDRNRILNRCEQGIKYR